MLGIQKYVDRFLAKSEQIQGKILSYVEMLNGKSWKIRKFGLSTTNFESQKPKYHKVASINACLWYGTQLFAKRSQ